ncbi:MAG: hypothetical protein FWC86_03895, partial [Coriobacteriia bacterium]|nr:hypothetical protein [Coriobacteriia bacterium]
MYLTPCGPLRLSLLRFFLALDDASAIPLQVFDFVYTAFRSLEHSLRDAHSLHLRCHRSHIARLMTVIAANTGAVA